jgi:outer membrane murein-binding lipoprotein Lpp
MKLIIPLVCAVVLTGCANTPQNRALWEGIAAGLNDAGNRLSQDAQQMRQNLHNSNQQQNSNRPLNCTTTFDGYGRAYTTCF